ncbi:hypothetical protein EON67_08340, partial [archaeon]
MCTLTHTHAHSAHPAVVAEAKIDFLQNTLMPDAITHWNSLLRTIPVQGPLYAYPACISKWSNYSPTRCAVYDSAMACSIGDGIALNIDAQYKGAYTVYPNSPNVPVNVAAAAGLADADFAIYVTMKHTSVCGTDDGGTLAYAITCQRDTFDRPTWGRINFCPRAINTAATSYNSQLIV